MSVCCPERGFHHRYHGGCLLASFFVLIGDVEVEIKAAGLNPFVNVVVDEDQQLGQDPTFHIWKELKYFQTGHLKG